MSAKIIVVLIPGQTKKSKGARGRPGDTTNGIRWWLSLVRMDTTDPQNHKCKTFFFEQIPKLAYTARDGTIKYKYFPYFNFCRISNTDF